MTNDELNRLDALAAAATPGPWYDNDIEWSDGNDGEQYPSYRLNPDNAAQDAAFIAAARDAVPALVAEVRRLRAYDRFVQRHARVIHEPAKRDVIGEIHGDRTAIDLHGYRVPSSALGFVDLDAAVQAVADA